MSYTSYIEDVKNDINEAAEQTLTEIGILVQNSARPLAPTDKGRLKQSITYAVDGRKVHVGSSVNYAGYVEEGTGIHNSKGRKTPWRYKDVQGNWHYTTGQKAQPFLKPAFLNNIEQIKKKASVKFSGIQNKS